MVMEGPFEHIFPHIFPHNIIIILYNQIKWFLYYSMQHVQKYGSAFLNSDGGVLMAGILDNGETLDPMMVYFFEKQSAIPLQMYLTFFFNIYQDGSVASTVQKA